MPYQAKPKGVDIKDLSMTITDQTSPLFKRRDERIYLLEAILRFIDHCEEETLVHEVWSLIYTWAKHADDEKALYASYKAAEKLGLVNHDQLTS